MIPRKIHFVYVSSPADGGLDFSFCYWVAVRSAIKSNPGYEVHLWYEHEPASAYWDDLKKEIILHQIKAPESIFGNPVPHYAHKADIVRLQVLLEEGGIYLDLDTLTVRGFDPLLQHKVVMSIAKNAGRAFGLGNAVIMSEPSSAFLTRWYESYKTFRSVGHDQYYDEHGAGHSFRLSQELPDDITVLGDNAFLTPDMTPQGLTRLFLVDGEYPDAFCHHLWGKNAHDVIEAMNEHNYEMYPGMYSRVLGQRLVDDIRRLRQRKAKMADLVPVIPRNAEIPVASVHEMQVRLSNALEGKTEAFRGRGIVMSVWDGDIANAWILLSELTRLRVDLPIEIWAPRQELLPQHRNLLSRLHSRVTFHDLPDPVKQYAIKPYAVYRSSFAQVLWLDNDCFPLRDPSFLFEDEEFQGKGSLFWRDVCGADRAHHWHIDAKIWKLYGMPYSDCEEFDVGQFLVDKDKRLPELLFTMYTNRNRHVYYRFCEARIAEKDTYRLAWQYLQYHRTGQLRSFGYLADPHYAAFGFMPYGPLHLGLPNPWHKWGGGSVMVQRDRQGKPLFNHRNLYKFALGEEPVYQPDIENESLYHLHYAHLREAVGLPWKS